jgi:hypothetical protein
VVCALHAFVTFHLWSLTHLATFSLSLFISLSLSLSVTPPSRSSMSENRRAREALSHEYTGAPTPANDHVIIQVDADELQVHLQLEDRFAGVQEHDEHLDDGDVIDDSDDVDDDEEQGRTIEDESAGVEEVGHYAGDTQLLPSPHQSSDEPLGASGVLSSHTRSGEYFCCICVCVCVCVCVYVCCFSLSFSLHHHRLLLLLRILSCSHGRLLGLSQTSPEFCVSTTLQSFVLLSLCVSSHAYLCTLSSCALMLSYIYAHFYTHTHTHTYTHTHTHAYLTFTPTCMHTTHSLIYIPTPTPTPTPTHDPSRLNMIRHDSTNMYTHTHTYNMFIRHNHANIHTSIHTSTHPHTYTQHTYIYICISSPQCRQKKKASSQEWKE